MIAIDTSSLKRYLAGELAGDTILVARVLASGEAVLPPIVLREGLSDPDLTDDDARQMLEIPLLQLYDGYWARAGNLRRDLITGRLSKDTADCLVAQACIDCDVPLITWDADFYRFTRAGLRLMSEV